MIAEKDWKWFGLPGHFICATECWHHLCTQVGGHLVSTVGNYHPNYKRTDEEEPREPQEIGYQRLYETYVFKLDDPPLICGCGCGMPRFTDACEIDAMPANTGQEADRNHLEMCRKYAAMQGTAE